MADMGKTAATTAMKAGGYYSERTRGAKDVIDNASDMLMAAVAAVPEPPPGRPIQIADFGAADGGTSRKAIRDTVAPPGAKRRAPNNNRIRNPTALESRRNPCHP